MDKQYELIERVASEVSKRYRLDYDHCLTSGLVCLDKDIWGLSKEKQKGAIFDTIRDSVCPKQTVKYRLYRGDVLRHIDEGMSDQEIIAKYRLGEGEFFKLKNGKSNFIEKTRRIRISPEWNHVEYNDNNTEDHEDNEQQELIDKFFQHLEEFCLSDEEEKLVTIVLTEYGLDIENEKQEVMDLFGFRFEKQLDDLFKRTEHKLKQRSPFRVLKDDS